MRAQVFWAWLGRALAVLLLASGAQAGAIDALRDKAEASFIARNHTAARTNFEALLQSSRAGKLHKDEFLSLARLGDIAARTGSNNAAAGWYRQALRLAQAHSDLAHMRPEMANRVAQSIYMLQDFTAASEAFRLGLKFAQDSNNPYEEANASRMLGYMEYERGNLAAARPLLEEAVVAAERMPADHAGARFTIIHSLLTLAELEFSAGRTEQTISLGKVCKTSGEDGLSGAC